MDSTNFVEIFSKDDFQLPIRWDGKDFHASLYKHLKIYRKAISKYCDDILRTEVKNICHGICAAVDYNFRGYSGKAYKSFEGVMEILRNHPLLIKKGNINEKPLYRVVDVGNGALINRQRVFHVPFSMRSNMSTQRYSVPGFPCLYLGSSIDLCLIELGKNPQRDYVCVSRYELKIDNRIYSHLNRKNQRSVFDNDKFMIIDVSIKPNEAIETMHHNNEKIIKYIKWYPLISACSYIRAMRNTPYSAEYIIPQLLIQWMRSEDEDALVGVKYFSCASEYASTLGYNYVFPTMGVGAPYHAQKIESDYCAKLANRFVLTAPRFLMEYASIDNCIDEINKDECLDYIDGYNVGENEEIEEIYTIPDGAPAIDAFAFYGSSSLTDIVIPDSVTSIGDGAFYGASSLTNIVIPDSTTSIGDKAFYGCISIIIFIIPNSVTTIGESAFAECNSLNSIHISINLTRIKKNTFYKCNSLTNFNLPNKVTSIGGNAFYECSSLTSINIPSSVSSIGNCAFSICSSLIDIDIPDSVIDIGKYAFSGCSSLKSINISRRVTDINDGTFYRCDSLTNINIPESVTNIGNYAFYGCGSLKSITIPNNVMQIGMFAFAGCVSLNTVYYSGTKEQAEKIIIDEYNDCFKNASWIYGP